MHTQEHRTGVDLRDETPLTLTEAAKVLPPLTGDRKVHVNTLRRWINRGVRGVRLEAVKLGRTLVTSREALQRFADRLSERPVAPAPATAHIDRTERELDRHGL